MRRFGFGHDSALRSIAGGGPALATESTAVRRCWRAIGRFGYSRSRSVLAELNRTGADYLPPLTLQSVVGFSAVRENPGIREIINGSCQYLFREVLKRAPFGQDFDSGGGGGCIGQAAKPSVGEHSPVSPRSDLFSVGGIGVNQLFGRMANWRVVDSLVTFMVALLPLLIPLVAARSGRDCRVVQSFNDFCYPGHRDGGERICFAINILRGDFRAG